MLTLRTRDKLVVISVHGGPKEVKDEQCKGGAAAEAGDRTLINTLQPRRVNNKYLEISRQHTL